MAERGIPVCLTIAGSDSGGGAGIQADLKAFARAGVHGATVVTAITAQNTVAVTAVEPVSAAMIIAQARAVLEDIRIDAVKIGMLGARSTVLAVADVLDLVPKDTPVVLDPVMVSESGGRLLEPGAETALREVILPRVTVATPNVPEARALAQTPELDGEALARAVHALGPGAVIVTGGHRAEAVDVVFDGVAVLEVAGPRYPDGAAHGSGCTHAATLAAHLARGATLAEAATIARRVAGEAVRDGLRSVGRGPGPVNVLGLADGR
jgi:hydroxymethylpyrimidine/phosphomethylpyrimidine kinase